MNKAKLVVLIITILLLLTGVAYARWTEQINILIQTKTAKTELSYLDYTKETESGKISVTKGDNAQATVNFEGIQPSSTNTVRVRFQNTGTIPIDIDDIKVLYVSGYSDEYKNDIRLTVSGYADERRFAQRDAKIFQWRNHGSSGKRDELYQLPANGIIDIICELEFDEVKNIDNYGQDKKEDLQDTKEDSEIMQDVSFVLKIDYKRFNQN